MQSMTSERAQQRAEIDRCRREIAAIEAQILAGHPDLDGLCLALADWSGELRLLQPSRGLAPVAPRLAHVRSSGDVLACRPMLPGIEPVGQESGQKQKGPPRQCRAGQEGGVRCY
jgi:hypothetical protein